MSVFCHKCSAYVLHNMEHEQKHKIKALREQLAVAVEALQFVGMPITTPKDLLTVDRLLATIAEDNQRVRETLKKLGVE